MNTASLITMRISLEAERLGMSHNSYSGRGMVGRMCFAVMGEAREIYSLVAGVTVAYQKEILDILKAEGFTPEAEKLFNQMIDATTLLWEYRQDNLGHGFVFYWPDLAPISTDYHEEDATDPSELM